MLPGDLMEIAKLSDYMAYVEQLPSEFSLSRGQSRDYPLLPSALRNDSKGNRKYSNKTIRNFLEEFKINSCQYIDAPWAINNHYEWMLYAQHYGIPTQLLDFTTSHLTSLLFAVEKAFQADQEDDAVVYFLNPLELNSLHIKQRQLINISKSSNDDIRDHDRPFAIHGRKINSRINAQRGLFVFFQNTAAPLETVVDESVLKKVTIIGSETRQILSTLYSMGVSFTHLYPELPSVVKDIVMQQDIEDYLSEEA